MKQEVTLNRSEQRSVTFMGELLIDESTKDSGRPRWFRCSIYKINNGYMTGIAHLTSWIRKRDWYGAEETKTAKDVVAFLKQHVPPIEDDPDGPKTADEQKDYLKLITRISKSIKADGQVSKKETSAS